MVFDPGSAVLLVGCVESKDGRVLGSGNVLDLDSNYMGTCVKL